MKIRASWVAFVPVTVGAVLLHLYYLFFIGGEDITQPLYGEYSLLINKTTEPEIIALLAAVLLIFGTIFSLADRKTAPYCEIKSAPVSGIFLIAAGLLMGMNSAVNVMSQTGESVSVILTVFYILGLFTALLLAIVGMGLLVGFNITKKIRGIMLLPTVWAAVNMVKAFSGHRKEASSFAMYDMFVWVTLTLFLFYNAMVLCGVEIKNPVKSSFVWGLVFVLYATIYVISEINESIAALGAFDFTQLIEQFMIAAFALYTLFMLFKLSSSMITKEQESEMEEINSSAPSKKAAKKTDDDEDNEPEAAFGVGSTKYVTAEFEKIRMEKAAKKAQERTGVISSDNASDEEDEEDESLSTLDKIDQLIQELSEDAQPKKSSEKSKKKKDK